MSSGKAVLLNQVVESKGLKENDFFHTKDTCLKRSTVVGYTNLLTKQEEAPPNTAELVKEAASMTTTFSSLPDEIMFDILSRLVVQDLSSCRFVCKSWHNIINNPTFVDSHHSRLDQHAPTFIIIHNHFRIGTETVEELFLVDDKNMTTDPMARPLSAYLPTEARLRIVGSCNGLLCLAYRSAPHSFFLVNPITKEIARLPSPPEVGGSNSKYGTRSVGPSLCGFAFDATTKTYKVFQAWYFRCPNQVLVIDLHTVGSGIWRRREILNVSRWWDTIAVFVNNALHWQMKDRHLGYHICALDVGAETITRLTFPHQDNDDVMYRYLSTINGCLAFFTVIRGEISVWMMKDYGVDESWTKQHTIGVGSLLGFANLFNFRTLQTMQNGCTMFCNGESLGYFNFRRKECQLINVPRIPNCEWCRFQGAVAHVGSLVSPKFVAAGKEIMSAMPNDDWKEVRDTETGIVIEDLLDDRDVLMW